MVDIFSDDENLERFYVVHRNVRIIPKGLISYMVLIIQQVVRNPHSVVRYAAHRLSPGISDPVSWSSVDTPHRQ